MTAAVFALVWVALVAAAMYLLVVRVNHRLYRRLDAAEDCIDEHETAIAARDQEINQLEDQVARYESALALMSRALLDDGDVDWGDLRYNYLLAVGGEVLAKLDVLTDWEAQ